LDLKEKGNQNGWGKKFKWTWAPLEAISKLFDISFQLSLGSTNGNTYIHIVKGPM
jgi:hypothetical protein